MTILKFLLRPLLRLAFLATVIAAIVWVLVGRPITRRVNDALSNALHQATSNVAAHDLTVLRERLDVAARRLDEAKSRRGRVGALLESAQARRVTLKEEVIKSRAVLKEIAGLLGSPSPVVMVADKPYSREVIEKDAMRTMRRYEQVAGQLRDLDGQIAELKAALARVDQYITRSEEVLASRDGLVSRLEGRAEYQRLLRDVGDLVSEDESGFEMRLERAAAVISPLGIASDDLDRDGTPTATVGAIAHYLQTGEKP